MHRTITGQTSSFPHFRSFYAALALGACLLGGAGIYAASPWADSAGAVTSSAVIDADREARRQRVLDVIAQPREVFLTYYLTDSEAHAEQIRFNEDQLTIDRNLNGMEFSEITPATVLVIHDGDEELAALEVIEQKRAQFAGQPGITIQVVDLRVQ